MRRAAGSRSRRPRGDEQNSCSFYPCAYEWRRKRKKTETHCFAPGCKTGYPGFRKVDGRTLSLFRAPQDDERRKQWERNLHRKDKPLCDSAVCERHFESHYIQRYYVHIINGQEVRFPRGTVGLAADAVPTLLPDLPAYLSKVSKKRPERKRPEDPGPSSKKVRLSRRDVHEPCPQDDTSVTNVVELDEPIGLQDISDNFAIPQRWTKLHVPDFERVAYATTSVSRNPFAVTHEKCPLFTTNEAREVVARVYYRGKEGAGMCVGSLTEAAKIMEKADAAILCKGVMEEKEFNDTYLEHLTEHLKASTRIVQGIVFSKSCSGASTETRKQLCCFLTGYIYYTNSNSFINSIMHADC
ncbi:hypothetical protein HPB48_026106 [Haemaphysalis longicornis]|uniref:THAP-type domain-containing protein n=1 Tax=Haemaphysalis longicornis TaxID=44386 RepID=A0A9J6HB81_HAELO|nr:hypothetical protein HPB48_026106 [Haemaphysalis longicornis]